MKLLDRFRQRNPDASIVRIAWWAWFCRIVSWLPFALLYRHRWWGARHVPDRGPVLLLCNHQSYLDLVALGLGLSHRHFHSMARASLFRHPSFSWLIRSLNAFPVEQGKGDIKALRRAIELLRNGNLVLVFPEGSRSEDGQVGPFQEGVMLLIRRTRPTVVPMAVAGTYDIWSLHRKWPRLTGRTAAQYGKPIEAKTLLDMPADQAIALLRRQIIDLHDQLQSKISQQTSEMQP